MIQLINAYKKKEKIAQLKSFLEMVAPVRVTPFRIVEAVSCAVISGSERIITEEGILPSAEDFLLKVKVPVIGICYGMQLISCVFGAQIENGDNIKGLRKVKIIRENLLTTGLPREVMLPESHRERIISVSDRLEIFGVSKAGIELVKVKGRDIYGTQFHFERSKKYGYIILKNFLRIAGEDV